LGGSERQNDKETGKNHHSEKETDGAGPNSVVGWLKSEPSSNKDHNSKILCGTNFTSRGKWAGKRDTDMADTKNSQTR